MPSSAWNTDVCSRSEEHTSELQSLTKLVCRLLLEKKEKRGIFDRVLSKLVISLDKGPMLILPVMDSSKDLGPNYGIMPIWAIRNKKKDVVDSVLAPSVNYNRYLKTSYTYRHYV